jgi:hypothetical protein
MKTTTKKRLAALILTAIAGYFIDMFFNKEVPETPKAE